SPGGDQHLLLRNAGEPSPISDSISLCSSDPRGSRRRQAQTSHHSQQEQQRQQLPPSASRKPHPNPNPNPRHPLHHGCSWDKKFSLVMREANKKKGPS